jgi:hypothetical protein
LRFAAPGLKPFEALSQLGLLLNRSTYTPRIVVLSTRWQVFIAPTILHDEMDTSPMRRYPEAANALLAELSSPAVSASPTVLQAVRDLPNPLPPPLNADVIDDRFGKWLNDHDLLERNLRLQSFFTYQFQRVEAPLQQALFGEVEQMMGPPRSIIVPDAALRDFNVDVFGTIIRLLRQRGATVFCYLAPHNPDSEKYERRNTLFPLDDWRLDITNRIRERARLDGCPFVDLTDALPGGPENWGYSGGERDPVHMRPHGIAEVGRILFEQGETLGIWKALDGQ